jgi:hypothetical protein
MLRTFVHHHSSTIATLSEPAYWYPLAVTIWVTNIDTKLGERTAENYLYDTKYSLEKLTISSNFIWNLIWHGKPFRKIPFHQAVALITKGVDGLTSKQK